MATIRTLVLALSLLTSVAGCTPARPGDQLGRTPSPSGTANSATPSGSDAGTRTEDGVSSPPSATGTRATGVKVSPAPSRTTHTSPAIPPLSAAAVAAGLVDIRSIVPDAVVDLRYATADNFVGVVLYPVHARCLVHQSMASGLRTAAARLRGEGKVLVFWDCYRPHAVQIHMFQVVPNPNWVARPGQFATSHEAARSVDVTLASAGTGSSCPAGQRVQGHCLVDMGTGFDDFTPRAYAFATSGVTVTEQSNRAQLRHAMNAGGIVVYSGEWWHFDGPGALVDRAQLDAGLTWAQSRSDVGRSVVGGRF
jgi:D-alanyl-D-alanine dipeptidase